MSKKPDWIDNYSNIVELAEWLPAAEWSHLSDADKLAEMLHFLGKPWNYDDEYRLMRCEGIDPSEIEVHEEVAK